MTADTPPPYSIVTPPEPVPPVGSPKLAISLASDPQTNDVLISLVPPREPSSESENGTCKRAPVDICCVIDVSVSMDSELKSILEEGGNVELTGLTTLDVVKHAVKTIVATMQHNDRIAIVSFSRSAEIVAGLTWMTTAGKTQVLNAVQKLRTSGNTNIWDGLKTGMNVLNGLAQLPTAPSPVNSPSLSSSRLSSLFLLTDGMPNNNPPRGILPMLETYLTSHPLRFNIHTFGFGYSLDSQLLLQISRLGHGVFGFIPDASSLGAVFIHAVANLYSTCADQVELNIRYHDGITDSDMEIETDAAKQTAGFICQDLILCSSGLKFDVGTVQYGQPRDFVFKIKTIRKLEESSSDSNHTLSVTARYRPWTLQSAEEPITCTVTLTRQDIAREATEEDRLKLRYHSHRFEFIHIVDDMFKHVASSTLPATPSATFLHVVPAVQTHLRRLLSSLQTPPLSIHPWASALGQDIEGEVLLALASRDPYIRWGQHYLVSLARHHLLQQCGSYRDPGLQIYGADSPLFLTYRDALDQAFDNIPPPKPSIIHTRVPTSTQGARQQTIQHSGASTHVSASTSPQAALVSMSTAFARRSGPCFDGTCLITLDDGEKMPVRMLQRGVRVQTPKGARNIVAVLKTNIKRGEALLCELPGGLKITPWHPIQVSTGTNRRWVFPVSQSGPEVFPCDAVYSLLLEPDNDSDAHSVYVQGVLCVTLGHGISLPPSSWNHAVADARTHPFLGNYSHIVHSLASFPVTDDGVFRVDHVLKDSVSGKICGFVPYVTQGKKSEGSNKCLPKHVAGVVV